MPSAWNASTVKAKVHWTCATGTSGAGIVWTVNSRANADGDTLDSAYGTPQSVTDIFYSSTAMYISSATPAITIGNTAAVDDFIMFEVTRSVSDASDTLGSSAALLGIKLQYTESSIEPSAW